MRRQIHLNNCIDKLEKKMKDRKKAKKQNDKKQRLAKKNLLKINLVMMSLKEQVNYKPMNA